MTTLVAIAPSADARYFRARCKNSHGSAVIGIDTTKYRVSGQAVKRSLITSMRYQITTNESYIEMAVYQRAVFSVEFPDNGKGHPWAFYEKLHPDGRVHRLNMKSGGHDLWPAGKWRYNEGLAQDVYYGYDLIFAFGNYGKGCTLKFYPYDGTV